MSDLTRGIYRRIYAGFIWGRRICEVSIAAEAWFWRLHAVADDYGNLPADEVRLSAEVKGRRDARSSDILRACAELTKAGLIHPYESAGDKFFHIADFEEMQPAPKNGRRVRKCPPYTPCGIRVNPGESGCDQENQASHIHQHQHTQEQTPPAPKGGDVAIPAGLNTPAFQAAWAEWEQHRKSLRVKPYTPQGLARQYASLEKLGVARAIAAIQYSIEKNWQGIFEPKPGSGHAQPVKAEMPKGVAW